MTVEARMVSVPPADSSHKKLKKYKKRLEKTTRVKFAEPFLCTKCNRVWQFKNVSSSIKYQRTTLVSSQYLDGFPKFGCTKYDCTKCNTVLK
jgi:transposase-like protein